MSDALLSALQAFGAGAQSMATPEGLTHLVMLLIAGVMFWLAIAKDVEPLLLLPIAASAARIAASSAVPNSPGPPPT